MPALHLTPAERKEKRGEAHHLDPVVIIGGEGLTDAIFKEADLGLNAHGLIKVRMFSDSRPDREAALAALADKLGAAPVQHIGKLLVLWRQAPAPEPVQVATTPARTRAKAPRTPPKTAGKKPRGNARTMVTTGAKRTPRAGTAKPTARKNRGAPRGATAASFAEEPGTRRRNRGAEPDERRGVARPAAKPFATRGAARSKAKAVAPRGVAAGAGRKPTSKRPPSPHGKSASSTGGASGARRRRKAR